jgi:hypothetical protein
MTLAEILLLAAGGAGIYLLLRPLQRWLERSLRRMLSGRQPRAIPPPIDVTDFGSHRSTRKDDRQT